MKQGKPSQQVIFKFPNVQLRERQWKTSTMFFITYTVNGKQHHEKLLSVPKRDKAGYKQAIEQCMAIARERDTQLSQGISGTMHIQARDKSFLEFFRLVENSKRNPTVYHNTRLKFEAFLKEHLKRDDVTFSGINANLAIEFRDYLVRLAERKEISFSTANVYLQSFRVVINEALRRELLVRNPCVSVKPIPKDTIEREFLTIEELQRLIVTPLPQTWKYDAQTLADYFLFICLTGIRPGDVRALQWQNIQSDGKGNAFVSFVPSKTKHKLNRTLIIPLHPEAVKILERQRAKQVSLSSTDKIFNALPPKSSPNAMIEFLKKWLMKAGIAKHITLYNARHTFASNLILSGVGILEVSRLLGHTTVTHTQVYSHLTEQAKRDAVNRLQLNLNP